MAIWHSSLAVVYPVNDAKDRGIRQPHITWLHSPTLKACMSKKLARLLSQHGIKAAHKPIRTVSSLFKGSKDQQKKEDTRGTVNKIKCNDCAAVYISQMSHTLKPRTKEHSKVTTCFDMNSLLAQHAQKTGHSFDSENVDLSFKHLSSMEPEVVL